MKRYIDLHVHTCYSDGVNTPQEVLEMVISKNLEAFAITDHDTLEGYWAMRKLLTDKAPELISGVELSVTMEETDVHLLAYLFDPDYPPLKTELLDFHRKRNHRALLMVSKLNELGVDINYEAVKKVAHGAPIGRPHIAQVMYDNQVVNYYEEAFEQYLGNDKPAYIPKDNFEPQKAIALIHQAGGLAVLAHPGIEHKDKYLEKLIGFGLDGIEVYPPSHPQADTDRFKHLYRLVITGGSDYHGRGERNRMIGSQKVPYDCLTRLKEKSVDPLGRSRKEMR
ncbi:MAG: PHP domain-containing protein [FCB group bacterium]|nr:PHP domain-containing protein [FCB group bacterium]